MKRVFVCMGIALMLGFANAAQGADDESAQLLNLVNKMSPAVVTVKALLKTQGGAGGQRSDIQSRIELQGVVVSTDGLVMISNTSLSPGSLFGALGNRGPGGDANEIKSVPSDIKIIFEQEEKEYSAFLAATDSKLNLAFLKIEDLNDRKLIFADFSKNVSPMIGQQVAAISRLQKGYDYAPFFETSRISGEIGKPRKAWLVDGNFSEFGLPVFDMNGNAIGALTTIQASAKNESNDESAMFAMTMRMMTGGGGIVRPFILPASVVNGVIAQARIRAVSVAAERAKNKTAKPTPSKPAKLAK